MSVSLHFEVTNSEMFGGEGSVGYTMVNFGGVSNFEKLDGSFVDNQLELTANILNVQKEDVKLISKEQYDLETEDDVQTEIDFDEGDW